jgi:glutathionylspermidine synthase
MRRIAMKPRADWRPGLRKYPFGVRAMGAGALWKEKARYAFTEQQVDLIEGSADEVHALLLEAVRFAVDGEHLPGFGIGGAGALLVERSWAAHWSGGFFQDSAGPLVGRLTFAFDGRDSLKLLEVQYDGAPGLFAAAIIQQNWREAQCPDAQQFNGLHEGLVERWGELSRAIGHHPELPVHFTCFTPDTAREGELAYVAAAAQEAGLAVDLLPIQAIGWEGGRFIDAVGRPIDWLYKLYPWQSIADGAFGQHLRGGGMTVVEPPWGWLASNHGLLALLWHRHPRHPSLCRAGGDPGAVAGAERVIQRGFLGLEHAETRLLQADGTVLWSNCADAPSGPCVWLELPPWYHDDEVAMAVVDAWMIDGKCLGMSVRESAEGFVGPGAIIAPHVIDG